MKIKSELKERVAKGLNFGIEAVEEVLDTDSALYNSFVLIKSKYNDLMYVTSINTMSYEQVELGLDRLRNNLLQLIDKIDLGSLKKEEVQADLTIHAMPTRRTNFFKLLDIHFKNLEDVYYTEIIGHNERKQTGRSAIFEIYQMQRRKFRNREDLKGIEGLLVLKNYFQEYFSHEKGMLEVYFKNIKHLLSYAMESEVERTFFLNTLKSLFSTFELGLIFYFAISNLDPGFLELVKKSQLIDRSVTDILIEKGHYDLVFSAT